MTCEKQFLPTNNIFLYCSESCRLHDQAPTYSSSHIASYTPTPTSPPLSPYTRPFHIQTTHAPDDGPDIIPRFSPTLSRPRSYFNSEPYSASYVPTTYSTSPPSQPCTSRSSTALASLRELATALPPTKAKSTSESHSPKGISRSGSGVWNYIPFTSSKTTTPTPATTPGNSYTNTQGYTVSTSYGTGNSNTYGGRKEDYTAGKTFATSAGYGNPGGLSMDRPLPPRGGPGGYGHRPRSIDLVTPFSQAQ